MLRSGHYHFAGVAGVGMSAVAQAVLATGCRVTGSDRYYDRGHELAVIGQLRACGVEFVAQDGSGIDDGTSALVVSTAIEPDNPDLRAAQAVSVPVRHRSQVLAELAAGTRCIAVTGTSGKSTVTGMIGHILVGLGADPTVINGAAVVNWRDADHIGNFRAGRSNWCVIEADESDRSVLNYHPDWGVVTNASADHFALAETLALFDRFKRQVATGVVSTLDEPALLEGLHVVQNSGGIRFEHGGLAFDVPIRGRHNAENALLAVVTCERLGFALEDIRAALAGFAGIVRRLEVVGSAGGVTVIDDYAHNPAKIRASWEAVSSGHGRVIGVWRPHGYGPLSSLLVPLARTFADVCRADDRVFILPVYDAGGTAERSVSGEDLVAQAQALGCPHIEVIAPEDVPRTVAAQANDGDVAITMGARDPDLPKLARQILAACAGG